MLDLDTFEYTRTANCHDSSFVSDVYYNENNSSMLVELYDENYDDYKWYLYKGVPLSVFHEFDSAASKGRFYNTQIKAHYGPAEVVPADLSVQEAAPTSATVMMNDDQKVTYEVLWRWNGQEMPAHVVDASTEDEAVGALTAAVKTLGLTGAKVYGLRYTAPVQRDLDITIS